MILSTILLFLYFSTLKGDITNLYKKINITTFIKFLAALLIVNGHIFVHFLPHTEFTKEIDVGRFAVSFFFFFSGYGLSYNIHTKQKQYLHQFIKKRFTKLIIPLITAYILFITCSAVFMGNTCHFLDLLQRLFSPYPILPYTWYVSEITIIYILFYLSYTLFKHYQYHIFIANMFIFIFILKFIDMPIWWIMSTPCFILGFIYYKRELLFIKCWDNFRYVLIPTFIVIFFFFFRLDLFATSIDIHFLHFIKPYAENFIFNLIIVYLLNVVPEWTKTKTLYKCSYEIYINQGIVLLLVSTLIDNSFILIIIGITMSLCVGFFMKSLNNKLNKIIFK